MEAFDLAVGLWPVGPGAGVLDGELGAHVTPQVRDVGRAVVGQHPLDDDAALSEPGHRVAQDGGGGGGGLVVVDLGVGDPGVVIDHGVHERGPHLRVVVHASWLARGRGPVAATLPASDVAPPAAVGDVAQLLDVHVQHRPGVVVLVAAHRFTGGPVHMGQPVQPAPDQHPVDRGGCDPHVRGELDRAQAFAQPQRHDPLRGRRGRLGRHRVRPARAVGHRLTGGVPGTPTA